MLARPVSPRISPSLGSSASLFIALVLLSIFGIIMPTAAVAAPKNNKYPPKKSPQSQAQQAARKAGEEIGEAKREVAHAAALLNASRAKLRSESNEAAQVRGEVRRDHDSSATLQSSRRLSEEGQRKYDELRAPVIERLAKREDYRAAVAERDALLKQLESPGAGPAERREQLEHDLAVARGNVHRMERDAIAADPKAKRALDELTKEQADLRGLVQQRDEKINHDSRLNQAQDDVREAKADVKAAEAKLAGANRHLANAEQNYVQKAVQAKRVTSNKPNSKRKPTYRR